MLEALRQQAKRGREDSGKSQGLASGEPKSEQTKQEKGKADEEDNEDNPNEAESEDDDDPDEEEDDAPPAKRRPAAANTSKKPAAILKKPAGIKKKPSAASSSSRTMTPTHDPPRNRIPPGWTQVAKRRASGVWEGKTYHRYIGPNGKQAASLKKAWALHKAGDA
jgi:hypothetical protein